MDISSWVTAIATTLLALITWFYVGLTKKILDAQTDPCIIVSTVHDANRPTIIQLVIKNIGSGLARDITFQCSQPLPQFAWGLTITDAKDAEVMSAGPLIDGISGLAPGEERTTSFKKNTKVMPPVVSAVDVKSYKDTTAARSLSAKVASDIENISKNIEHLTSGFRSLRIELDDKNKFDQRDEPLGNNNK